jgi:hypothetical protein
MQWVVVVGYLRRKLVLVPFCPPKSNMEMWPQTVSLAELQFDCFIRTNLLLSLFAPSGQITA